MFTGGSLLYGSVGRTDLLGEDKAEELTRHQFRSAKRLDDLLGDDARIFPTHGFGSFCSAGSASGADSSTLGEERRSNDALTTSDEDAFVARLLAGFGSFPDYFRRLPEVNQHGLELHETVPALEPLTVEEPTGAVLNHRVELLLHDRTAYSPSLRGSRAIRLVFVLVAERRGWGHYRRRAACVRVHA